MLDFRSCFARTCCLLVDEEASGASMMIMSSDVSDLRLRERAVPVDGTMASRCSVLLEAKVGPGASQRSEKVTRREMVEEMVKGRSEEMRWSARNFDAARMWREDG